MMQFENGSLTAGKWNGAPIKIHWTVFLCAFFFGGFRLLPVYWLFFFFVVFIHEAGHALMVRRFGLRVDEIAVHGVGGFCGWQGAPDAKTKSLIAWGGVGAQIVLLLLSIGIFGLLPPSDHTLFHQIYHALVGTNIWMILLNLLPIEPLDGAEAWKILGGRPSRWWGRPGPGGRTEFRHVGHLRRISSQDTLGLWVAIVFTVPISVGSMMGIDWGWDAQNPFGRLLLNPEVALLQTGGILVLFILLARSKTQPDWLVVAFSILFSLVCAYHFFYYLVVTDLFILLSLMRVIHTYSRKQDA